MHEFRRNRLGRQSNWPLQQNIEVLEGNCSRMQGVQLSQCLKGRGFGSRIADPGEIGFELGVTNHLVGPAWRQSAKSNNHPAVNPLALMICSQRWRSARIR